MNEQDVVAWLQANPQFFETQAELLAAVQLTSPHGDRAISLQERQMVLLLDKNRLLDARIAELLRYGQENDRTQQRLRTWLLSVLSEHQPYALPNTIARGVEINFDVPQAAVRVWDVAESYADMPFALPVSSEVRAFASCLSQPFCGANNAFEQATWLDAPTPPASVVMIALRRASGDVFGLLVLGSPDPARFHEGMGTAYLSQIGEFASAALTRLLVH